MRLAANLSETWYNISHLRGAYFRFWSRYRLRALRQRIASGAIGTVAVWIVGLLVFTGLALSLYRFEWSGFGDYTTPTGEFVRGKTLWDWLSLLIIPGLLLSLARFLSQQQEKRELAVARLHRREQALHDYLKYMTDLFLGPRLRSAEKSTMKARLARAATLTILDMLDGRQKGHVLRFLAEAEFIKKGSAVFSMRRADLSGAELEPGNYNDVDLTGANLDGANLEWCAFAGAELQGITMQRAHLESVDLTGANLNYADLSHSDLYNARLSRVHLYKSRMRQVNLQYAHLDEAQLARADLGDADLRAADLEWADLSSTNLAFANLHGASLSHANLTNSNLQGAKLSSANLQDSNLTGAYLRVGQLRRALHIEGISLGPPRMAQRTRTPMKQTRRSKAGRKQVNRRRTRS